MGVCGNQGVYIQAAHCALLSIKMMLLSVTVAGARSAVLKITMSAVAGAAVLKANVSRN